MDTERTQQLPWYIYIYIYTYIESLLQLLTCFGTSHSCCCSWHTTLQHPSHSSNLCTHLHWSSCYILSHIHCGHYHLDCSSIICICKKKVAFKICTTTYIVVKYSSVSTNCLCLPMDYDYLQSCRVSRACRYHGCMTIDGSEFLH